MADTLFIDFETRSRVNLPDVGASRYAEDDSTEILCCAYAFNNEEPKLWTMGQLPPTPLIEAINNGVQVRGWNALSFERAIFKYVAGPRLGWPVPKLEQLWDTMHDALALGFPASLEMASEALNPLYHKDKRGRSLITKLCKPISTGRLKGQFRERSNEFLPDFVALYEYCKQDVRTERSVYTILPRHVQGVEREIQLLIARMNERGLPIDYTAVVKILDGIRYERERIQTVFQELTGLNSPTQRDKTLQLVNELLRLHQLEELPDLQGLTVENALKCPAVEQSVGPILRLRQRINHSSVAKYEKILQQICTDGTIKDNLIYHKATTGRLAGAGFQPQNLPRHAAKDPEPLLRCFVDEEYDFLDLYDDMLETAASLIRSTIKAEQGMKFLSGDLKGIEARGTSWVACEWDILENYRKGIDAYVSSAAGMYRITVLQVDKEQRQAGKIAVLSGGFGGGWRALHKMAEAYGIEMSIERAMEIIRDFRRSRPKLVRSWYAFGDASVGAIENPGGRVYVETNRRFYFLRQGNYLFLVLPNGRHLSFPFPDIEEEMWNGRLNKTATAMWVSSYTRKWERRKIIGSNFFQSAVQGMCRDILMEAHLRLEQAGFPCIMSVHDESVSQVPDSPAYRLEDYNRIMCEPLSWCPELPIESDGWEGGRYRK